MAVSSIYGVDFDSYFETPSIKSQFASEMDSLLVEEESGNTTFNKIFDSAVALINQTNAYSNAAEEEELKFALGETDSIHDLMVAQQKANVSLQYTVAVRDAFLSGYRELMNMQF